jgi:CrcB protein
MLEIQKLFLVGVGGSAGAMIRYVFNRLFIVLGFTATFPFHTLVVNILGCFLIGLLAPSYPDLEKNQMTRLFLMTGVLGGFTTFSAFSIETIELFKNGSSTLAVTYIFGSIAFGLLAVLIGISLASHMLK